MRRPTLFAVLATTVSIFLLPPTVPAGAGRTVGESCSDATLDTAPLPFITSGDTSAGALDDVDLSAAGPCLGGGNQFSETGTGPDLFYRVRVDTACTLRAELTPTDGADLAVYVIGACTDAATTCLGVNDSGGPGDAEQLDVDLDPTMIVFVVVDGYAGQAGAFDLTLADADGTGCSLVPVETQSFTVE